MIDPEWQAAIHAIGARLRELPTDDRRAVLVLLRERVRPVPPGRLN